MKYFFILLIIFAMLLHCSSGEITSSRNKHKNIATDSVTLYIYNGLVSTNVQTIELSRTEYADRRIDYTFRLLLQLEEPLYVHKVDIDIEGSIASLARPIYRNYLKTEDGSLERLLFFIDEDLIKKMCHTEDMVLTLSGKRGKATFALLPSHYKLLSEFYDTYMRHQ